VLDTDSGAFTTYATTGLTAGASGKYSGAAAVGTTVYFGPYSQDNVGYFDTVNNVFGTLAATGLVTSKREFCGAATVGNSVYFVPYDLTDVGVLA